MRKRGMTRHWGCVLTVIVTLSPVHVGSNSHASAAKPTACAERRAQWWAHAHGLALQVRQKQTDERVTAADAKLRRTRLVLSTFVRALGCQIRGVREYNTRLGQESTRFTN